MTPQARRRLVPAIVILAATCVLLVVIFGPKRANTTQKLPDTNSDISSGIDLVDETKQENGIGSTPRTSPDLTPESARDSTLESTTELTTESSRDSTLESTTELTPESSPDSTLESTTELTPTFTSGHTPETNPVVSPEETAPQILPPTTQLGTLGLQIFVGSSDPITLGALDNIEQWQMEAQFIRAGAGISSIRFSDIFETVDGKHHWKKYRADGGNIPPIDELYLLTKSKKLEYQTPSGVATFTASVLGAFQIAVNGQTLHLTSPQFWKVTAQDDNKSVSFEAIVINEQDDRVIQIVRKWTIGDQFDLHLQQTVHNLSKEPVNVQWVQYGPPSLTVDRSRYMDRRRFRFGWELSDAFDPGHAAPIQSNDFLYEYADAAKQNTVPLWPTDETITEGHKLSWFASTNRYFALAVFPDVDDNGQGNRIITNKIEKISSQKYGADETEFILTALWSPYTTIASGESFDLAMNVYAGPLSRSVLDTQEPYISLSMRDLVLYQMSSMCAFCTFQWLADFLAVVLTFLNQHVLFDWGFAIIFLVLIVRSILHPITKKSQINMQRFGKVMQKLKPEIEKLKAKYPNEPKKVQAEQMALMQKYGVNPFQMLGCLPMFLQMPIWIALYALLYFMFDIRQEPAFFGVFQLFGNWSFLADLSASDHFFGHFDEPIHFLFWNITGINILPLLMGVIFYVQQKYMTPSVATSPEQESQQKIMRIMMVVMFPLMLYSAPSGLTLYILTSSSMGILESKHIRKHIDNLDIVPKTDTQPTSKQRKPKDKQGRAWADAMEARRKKVENKAKKRNFKKRS